MNNKIRGIAKELNIDIIGFTGNESLFGLQEVLELRMSKGLVTEFEPKSVKERIDPAITLKGCKGIITIAVPYNTGYDISSRVPIKGSLSRSSWGRDYHKVVGDLLRELSRRLKSELDGEYLPFADTGPLVDRELAYMSGLGYYGKNCCIITPGYGSYVFIGYILTSLELSSEVMPIESQCGDCRLCIDACPTGALEKPGVLNPKKCISYLTQTKDIIPTELQRRMGVKIYGCDTCQAVCPKNKGVNLSDITEFLPVKTGGFVDIEELLKMSKNEYIKKYGDMAGNWRGRSVLIRNAIIAISNIGRESQYKEQLEGLKKKEVELWNPYL